MTAYHDDYLLTQLLIYFAILPSVYLAIHAISHRDTYMPVERRLLQTIKLCTLAVCVTIIFTAAWLRTS